MHLFRESVARGDVFHHALGISLHASQECHTPVGCPLQHPLTRRFRVSDRFHSVVSRQLEGASPRVKEKKSSVSARQQRVVVDPSCCG